ncbi:MAG: BlaI/MecI/CopY family transcriptional regulator, partial [Candidatus Hydrogenedentes bacterium]|nr:BlaI/MecI/CopY family transcriptional regulator [Candidatus Hydrogenedentota bacterium]
MPRIPSRFPTDLELAILKILWQRGPSTVRQVRDELAKERDLAYTSVMTIMTIMADKGYVRRRKSK